MTPAQQSALEGIVGRPLTAGDITALDPLVEARNDAGIATYLSTGRTAVGLVPRHTFSIWCGTTGLRSAIEDNAGNSASPLRAICLTLRDFLQGATADSIDFANPDNITMLNAWVSVGALTPAQSAQLLAMASAPAPIDVMTVRRVMWADNGDYFQ